MRSRKLSFRADPEEPPGRRRRTFAAAEALGRLHRLLQPRAPARGRHREPGRRVPIDGVAGTRTNNYPSVDIANGAPTGVDATDRIVMAWANGPLSEEKALVQYSDDSGDTWSNLMNAAAVGDRPNFPAIAISPDGRNVGTFT